MKDVVTVAGAVGGFSTFAKAAEAAGLGQSLMERGPYTVFAPTDTAFARMPAAARESLLADGAQLAATLANGVITGRLTTSSIFKQGSSTPPNANGGRLAIRVRDGKVFVNGAMVVRADLAGANGVIHGVDTVLLPEPLAVTDAR